MVAAILEGGRVTIDVAKLRRFAEEAGWPSVSPSEFVELLDAYEERDRLREALEFYADPDTYKATPSGSQNSWGNYEVIDYPIGDDEGEIARAALEGRE